MCSYTAYKKGYLLGADNQYHKVPEEIWREYMRSVWREEAAIKRDRMPVMSKSSTKDSDEWVSFPKVVSYDSVLDAHGEVLLPRHRSAEDEAVSVDVRTSLYTNLHEALQALTPDELFLIERLYLDGLSIREFSSKYGQPRTTVQYRRNKAVKKLRALMEKTEGFSKELIPEIFDDEGR